MILLRVLNTLAFVLFVILNYYTWFQKKINEKQFQTLAVVTGIVVWTAMLAPIALLSVDERKDHMFERFERVRNFLLMFVDDDESAGFLILICHYLPVLIIAYLFISYPFQAIFVAIAISLYLMDKQTNGCIYVRLERYLFKTREWTSVFNYIKQYAIDQNSFWLQQINLFFWVFMFAMLLYKVLKYDFKNKLNSGNVFKRDKTVFGVLFFWLLPSLFM